MQEQIAEYEARKREKVAVYLERIEEQKAEIEESLYRQKMTKLMLRDLEEDFELNKYLVVMKLGLILVVVRIRGPCEPDMMWLEDAHKGH